MRRRLHVRVMQPSLVVYAGCKVISERLFGRAFSKGSRLGPLVGVSFGTYTAADGVKAGIYVLRFAQLQPNGKHYVGPDALRNHYNDPDKNAQIAEFKIDHKGPEKKDYAFDFKLDNPAAVEPGPHALKICSGETRDFRGSDRGNRGMRLVLGRKHETHMQLGMPQRQERPFLACQWAKGRMHGQLRRRFESFDGFSQFLQSVCCRQPLCGPQHPFEPRRNVEARLHRTREEPCADRVKKNPRRPGKSSIGPFHGHVQRSRQMVEDLRDRPIP